MLLLLAACAAPVSDALVPGEVSPPAETALHADGTTLRDDLGRLATFRGVNAGGRSKFAPYSPFDYGGATGVDYDAALADYLDRAATWGITGLRVPFTWAALEPVQGQWDEEWLARYDALVDGAAARGMWVVVDFHQDVYGEFYCGDGFPAWTVDDPPAPHHDCPDWFFGYMDDPEVDAAFDAFWADTRGTRTAHAAMWSALAEHLAGRAGVIGFEPINEPGPGTADTDTWSATTLTDFYSDIAVTLQTAAPGALVFVDPTGLDGASATTALARPDGDNLVFAPHYYDPAILMGADSISVDPAEPLGRWAAVGDAWDVPVWLGEYGADPDLTVASEYGSELYDALDAYGLGATWWEYSVAAEAWNEEDLGLVEADGAENAVLVDVLARPVPRFVAGDDVVVTYVGGTWTLTYEATAGGVTEITLPMRAASDPTGWPGAAATEIRGTGAVYDRRADRVYLRADVAGPVRVEVGR